MTTVSTVTINSPGGPIMINKSDYDKAKHKLYVVLAPGEIGDVKPELDPSKQSVVWLKIKLSEKDVNFDGAKNKADLLKLYEMSHG